MSDFPSKALTPNNIATVEWDANAHVNDAHLGVSLWAQTALNLIATIKERDSRIAKLTEDRDWWMATAQKLRPPGPYIVRPIKGEFA